MKPQCFAVRAVGAGADPVDLTYLPGT